MGLIFENFAANLIFYLITLFSLIYVYFMYCYTYWERKQVPFVTPTFPYGNSQSLKGESVHFGPFVSYYYDLIKEKGLKYGGIYIMNRPVLILRDPEYIKDILTKDFEFFPNRTIYYNEPNDPISAHLFAIEGARWKSLRSKLTPTFTSGKIKSFFPTMVKLSSNLTKTLNEAADAGSDIDIFEYSAKFTTDIICDVAFGLESNTFENSESQFRIMARKVFEAGNIFDKINGMIIGKAPNLARKLGLIGTNKEFAAYFHNLIGDTCKYRKDNNVKRLDFLQLLIDLMQSTANTEDPFTWEDVVAQCFLFYFAGFDTSSTTLLFTLYELGKDQDIQDKLREEIEMVLDKYNGEITYEALAELKYMQQVIDESQRLYPPITILDRKCVKDYKLRDSNGTVGKGVTVLISTISLQRDPDYYPDPYRFDPERFSPENKKLRHPHLHLPFGEGPRNCIGLRFGLVQTKVGLLQILRNFKLSVSPSTKPLVLDDYSIFLRPLDTIYLKATRL